MVSGLPRLVLGSAQWGQNYGIANASGPPSDRSLTRMLELAHNRGVTTIDTGRAYGEAERRIGALAQESQNWRIITKIDPNVWTDGDARNEALTRLRESMRLSRRALSPIPIDTVMLHRGQHAHELKGLLWHSLIEARATGLVRAIGVSAASAQEALEALPLEELDVIQVPTSLVDQRLLRAGFFDEASSRSIEVFVRSVYLQGALLGRNLSDALADLRPVRRDVSAWCASKGRSVAELLLAFVRDRCHAKVVVGCETPAQLKANLDAWCSPQLEPDELTEVADLVPQLPDSVLDPSQWSS